MVGESKHVTVGAQLWVALTLLACNPATEEASTTTWQGDDGSGDTTAVDDTTGAVDTTGGDVDVDTGSTEPEIPPEPAEGEGVFDPTSKTLHNHCVGTDWQVIDGWVLQPQAAPTIGPSEEIERCVERYEGWVTNEADDNDVSRASVYAAVAAAGQCDADNDYDGDLLLGSQCTLVHPELGPDECLARMSETRAFGIATLAAAIGHETALDIHRSDPPLIAAWLSHGVVECGGVEPWKLAGPDGYVDRYVAAYNAYAARTSEPPACAKRIVVSAALYTGMDVPGVDGVTAANGCWTFERIAKQSAQWKICNYDGSVFHEDGWKWAYDDTNTNHVASQDVQRILDCKAGVPGRGYVYMTNRGSGWPKRVTEGVTVHFAQVYSGQYAINDQFNLWKQSGKPGAPMINIGEPTTSASQIHAATSSACSEVVDGGYLGVYIYPESLRGGRMSAMVEALNACTGL